MIFLNYTSHEVTLFRSDGTTICIPPEGTEARARNVLEPIGEWEGIPLVRSSIGDVQDLPAPQPGVCLLVSQMVAAACPDRDDLFFPTNIRRDEKYRILGAEALARM